MKIRDLFILTLAIAFLHACDNDVIKPMDIDDPPPDTVQVCSPDTLYFLRDVLPVFLSSCGFDLCHDAGTQSGGHIFTSYTSITSPSLITPFEPDNSLLYQKITETNLSNVMPPSPRGPLSDRNIEVIRKWIEQGAQNLFCNSDTICEIPDMPSFETDIFPIIDTYCEGCHSGSNPWGGIFLRNYSDVKQRVDSGQLMAVIRHEPGFPMMPNNMDKLDSCLIETIQTWVDNGGPDN